MSLAHLLSVNIKVNGVTLDTNLTVWERTKRVSQSFLPYPCISPYRTAYVVF